MHAESHLHSPELDITFHNLPWVEGVFMSICVLMICGPSVPQHSRGSRGRDLIMAASASLVGCKLAAFKDYDLRILLPGAAAAAAEDKLAKRRGCGSPGDAALAATHTQSRRARS